MVDHICDISCLFLVLNKIAAENDHKAKAPHAGRHCRHALQVVVSKLCLWHKKIDRFPHHETRETYKTVGSSTGMRVILIYLKEVLFLLLASKSHLKPFLIMKGF